MKITSELIEKHQKLSDEHREMLHKTSDAITDIKHNYLEREVEVPDDENPDKMVKVKESALWEELRYGSPERALDYFKKTYPEVWEMQAETDRLAHELVVFQKKNFGFTFQEMTMDRLWDLVSAMIDYKLKE